MFRVLCCPKLLLAFALSLVVAQTDAWAIEIIVDYTYDTENFFDTQEKRDAIEAAAGRYSRVITSSLNAVGPEASWRIGFQHPATGEIYEISTERSQATDFISTPYADEYGFPGLNEDELILYVGGRSLSSSGIGGTATGTNFTNVFQDFEGPLHRGLIPVSSTNPVDDLPVWGGAVSFNLDADWSFSLDTVAPGSAVDFYTIALHEIGHVLGLSSMWNQWTQHVVGTSFLGENAVAAYNRDNGTSLSSLAIDPSWHWQEGTYRSYVFAPGEPASAVAADGELQDLLLEPQADFSGTIRRLELTNVDVAALVDIGWSVAEAVGNPLDRNGDDIVDRLDVDLACGAGENLTPYFTELRTVRADIDFDGAVEFSDFLTLASNFNSAGTYSAGDISCDGLVSFADFLTLSAQFGTTPDVQSVPEPTNDLFMFLVGMAWLGRIWQVRWA